MSQKNFKQKKISPFLDDPIFLEIEQNFFFCFLTKNRASPWGRNTKFRFRHTPTGYSTRRIWLILLAHFCDIFPNWKNNEKKLY